MQPPRVAANEKWRKRRPGTEAIRSAQAVIPLHQFAVTAPMKVAYACHANHARRVVHDFGDVVERFVQPLKQPCARRQREEAIEAFIVGNHQVATKRSIEPILHRAPLFRHGGGHRSVDECRDLQQRGASLRIPAPAQRQ